MSQQVRKLLQSGGVGPRLVSPSVRAAEQLPSSVKIESVKNQLLRKGAKPVELKYSQLDTWLEGKEGDRIAADDVAEYLRKQGPLGRLERYDARGPSQEDIESDFYDNNPEADDPDSPLTAADYFPEQPRLSSDPAFPSGRGNPQAPVTKYPDYTEVAAFPWSDADYNEVLWKQREKGQKGPVFGTASVIEAYDPHDAHMWVRYHMNRDAIDVQNVQSDLGQKLARHDRAGPPPDWYQDGWQRTQNLLTRVASERPAVNTAYRGDYGDVGGDPVVEAARKLHERSVARGPAEWMQASPRTYLDPSLITLLENDNWRQIPLRYLLLESAAQGGKPIRFPVGHNVSRVEYMPSRAAQKMYERDLPNAMMKILKPIGGGERSFSPIVRRIPGTVGVGAPAVGIQARGAAPTRAGTTITPSRQAIEYIQKNGLDVLALMMMAGGGATASQQQAPVTQELLK